MTSWAQISCSQFSKPNPNLLRDTIPWPNYSRKVIEGLPPIGRQHYTPWHFLAFDDDLNTWTMLIHYYWSLCQRREIHCYFFCFVLGDNLSHLVRKTGQTTTGKILNRPSPTKLHHLRHLYLCVCRPIYCRMWQSALHERPVEISSVFEPMEKRSTFSTCSLAICKRKEFNVNFHVDTH